MANTHKTDSEFINDPKVIRIVGYAKQGLKYWEIAKKEKFKINQVTVGNYIKRSIELGLITKEEIEAARNDRKIREELEEAARKEKEQEERRNFINAPDTAKVLEYLRQGLSYAEMEQKGGFTVIAQKKGVIYRYAQKCIEYRLITQREIDEAKERRKDEKFMEDPNTIKILEYLKQGLGYTEISQKEEFNVKDAQGLVYRYMKKCIQLGLIEEDKIHFERKHKTNEKGEEKKENAIKIPKARKTKTRREMSEDKDDESKNGNKDVNNADVTDMMEYLKRETADNENLQGKENSEEQERKLRQIKTRIDVAVRIKEKNTDEEKKLIREYVNQCFKIYKNKAITKLELDFLKKAMQKIPLGDKDIMNYTRCCISAKKYIEIVEMTRTIEKMPNIEISEDMKNELKNIERIFVKAGKVELAIATIEKGNTNTEVLSSITGLSKDEINILKIKLHKQPATLLTVEKRNDVISKFMWEEFTEGNNEKLLEKRSDFEKQDIFDQMRSIRIGRVNDDKIQAKQDSLVRTVALLIKLGVKKEKICSMIKELESTQQLEEQIDLALNAGLLKENELNGINPLNIEQTLSRSLND